LNSGDYRARISMRGIQIGNNPLSRFTLLFRGVKDDGAILRANVISLAVQRGGIMNGEKYIEQIAKRDFVWIENHSHYFHMSGSSGTDLPVGGIIHVSTHITGLHRLHS